VTRLYRRDDVPEEDCWLRGEATRAAPVLERKERVRDLL